MRILLTMVVAVVLMISTAAAIWMPIRELTSQALVTTQGVVPDYQIRVLDDAVSSLCLVVVSHTPSGRFSIAVAPEDTCASRR